MASEIGALRRTERRRYAEGLSLAWHAAAFQRVKRLPRLDTLLRRLEEPARRGRRTQTREEQIALFTGLGVT